MGKIFLTSDTHFCHGRPFCYKERGFLSVEHMNKEIVEKWNSVVSEDDEVYHLGDVMLNDNERGIQLLKSLNGKIHIILGNHDTKTRKELYLKCDNVIDVQYATLLKYKKYTFFLSHYPTLTANYDDEEKPWHKNLFNLHGHTHQKEFFFANNCYMYNVGVDAHNCYPVLLDHIITDIRLKKEGWFV